jgi:hypothetical protein
MSLCTFQLVPSVELKTRTRESPGLLARSDREEPVWTGCSCGDPPVEREQGVGGVAQGSPRPVAGDPAGVPYDPVELLAERDLHGAATRDEHHRVAPLGGRGRRQRPRRPGDAVRRRPDRGRSEPVGVDRPASEEPGPSRAARDDVGDEGKTSPPLERRVLDVVPPAPRCSLCSGGGDKGDGECGDRLRSACASPSRLGRPHDPILFGHGTAGKRLTSPEATA